MRTLLRGSLALGVLALGGCAVNHYRVSMTPAPGGVRREVACWRDIACTEGERRKAPFPADALAKVARAYGKPVPEADEETHVFDGVFTDATPDDVGGAGFVVRSTTSLGSVWRYAERFRGDPDPLAEVERRLRAADRISDFLVAWLGTEMEGQPGWDRLRTFLAGPLRRDLKNLALLDASFDEPASSDGSADHRSPAVMLFLVERGYVRRAELPLDRNGPELTRRVIARCLGVADTEAVPAFLSLLDEARLEASLAAFSSSEFVARMWKERAAESPGLPPMDPTEDAAATLLGHLVAVDLLDVRLLGDRDVVEVSWACGVEPTETNGEWRAEEGRVVWPSTAMHDRGFPGLLRHATWAVPDADAQRARFGQVAVAGDRLVNYAAWRAAMPAEAGARWDAAIAAISPGEGLASRIEGIRLPMEDGTDAAKPLRTLLLEALGAAR